MTTSLHPCLLFSKVLPEIWLGMADKKGQGIAARWLLLPDLAGAGEWPVRENRVAHLLLLGGGAASLSLRVRGQVVIDEYVDLVANFISCLSYFFYPHTSHVAHIPNRARDPNICGKRNPLH
jgi:hypothetical protein